MLAFGTRNATDNSTDNNRKSLLFVTRARAEAPLHVAYRGGELFTVGPPTQGLTTLQILALLERFDLAAVAEGSADHYHLMIEAIKLAFMDRDRHVGDPEFVDVPVRSLLSREQDALYEITQALRMIELGTYGICEMSGNPIPCARLEAIPFARFTVECQSQLEKQNKASRVRQSVTSLFGLTEDEGPEAEEEEAAPAPEKE